MGEGEPKDARESFLAGVRDVFPIVVGLVPIALVAGIGAVSAGLPGSAAIAMSLFWFAGAAQLAAIGVFDTGAPLAAVVATALVVNLRYVMYSASIATFLGDVRDRWKWAMSYFLADQNYALSVVRYESDATVHRVGYYFGAALSMWVVWQTGTVVGVVVGAQVPDSWRLDLALPLTFMALLAPALKDRPSWAAALVAGVVAVAGAGLPANAGLMLAAVLGVATGYLLSDEEVGGVEP